MKYMTKEWYQLRQKTNFHLQLRTSLEAESFSENYFRKLYARKEMDRLKIQAGISKIRLQDIFPDESQTQNLNYLQPDLSELEITIQEQHEMKERALSCRDTSQIFDLELEKKKFKKLLRQNIKYLRSYLPIEILQKVADIRVLALYYASTAVKKEITAYCKSNKETAESILNEFKKEYEKSILDKECAFLEDFFFHDCIIISSHVIGKDLVLTLDNSDGYTRINQIIFKNCSILKQDAQLKGARWLYEEV